MSVRSKKVWSKRSLSHQTFVVSIRKQIFLYDHKNWRLVLILDIIAIPVWKQEDPMCKNWYFCLLSVFIWICWSLIRYDLLLMTSSTDVYPPNKKPNQFMLVSFPLCYSLTGYNFWKFNLHIVEVLNGRKKILCKKVYLSNYICYVHFLTRNI